MLNKLLERGGWVAVVPNPVDTLFFGAATRILIGVLIQYYKAKAEHGE